MKEQELKQIKQIFKIEGNCNKSLEVFSISDGFKPFSLQINIKDLQTNTKTQCELLHITIMGKPQLMNTDLTKIADPKNELPLFTTETNVSHWDSFYKYNGMGLIFNYRNLNVNDVEIEITINGYETGLPY